MYLVEHAMGVLHDEGAFRVHHVQVLENERNKKADVETKIKALEERLAVLR